MAEDNPRNIKYNPETKRIEPRREGDSGGGSAAKFQGFTAGGPVKSDPNEPKRSSFPEGLAGQAAYSKALSEYRSKTKKQSESLGKASQ